MIIRWYCCLGTGDAPEQVVVERKVAEDFNASHPGIHLQFEGFVYAAARDALAVQLGSGAGPDIVGPLGIGGAEAFHGQWLDLQPLIDKNGFDMTQFPESTVDLYNAGGEGQLGIPYAIYPSVLFYKADMFKEAGLNEPPHEWNAEYTMPDGSKRAWDYDTVREIAKILTVDENGADATEAGFDPEKIVQWGFEPQRDDLRQTGAYFGAGGFMATDGKTVQIPEPWVAAWKHFYDGIWTDHFSMTGPKFETTDLNPAGYPFCAGKVAMSTNYLWSTYCVGDAGDDWNMAATPSYQWQDDRRVQRRHVADPEDQQEPRPGIRSPAVPVGQRGTARALRRHAGRRVEAGCVPASPSSRTTRRASTGRSRRRASHSPTCRTSSPTCRPTTRRST